MPTEPEHSQATRRSGYRYCFLSKHHGAVISEDAQWSLDIARDEEFSVFDSADFFEIADESGRLYGVLRSEEDVLRLLGTWQQQVAEFPKASEGAPWHGYPIWSVNDAAPRNRAGEAMRPAKAVFVLLEQAGLITKREKKRLWKGRRV